MRYTETEVKMNPRRTGLGEYPEHEIANVRFR